MPGIVGKTEWVESAETGRYVRTVEAGVVYVAPGKDPTHWSPKSTARGGVSTYSTGALPSTAKSVQTLFDLANELRDYRDQINATDTSAESVRLKAKLEVLDWIVRELLLTVEKLHKNGKSIGLLHPLNVCWYQRPDGGLVLFLPDVGFSLQKGVGTLPEWLDTSAVEVFRRYRDRQILPRTTDDWARLFRAAWYSGWDNRLGELVVTHDLTVVARILEWVLTGAVRTDKAVAGDNERSAKTPAYLAIRDVILGGIRTVTELMGRLIPKKGTSAVAQAYLKPPRAHRPGRRSGRAWLVVFGVLAVAVLGGVMYWIHLLNPAPKEVASNGPTKPIVPLCPDCPPESPLIGPLGELDAVLRTAQPDSRTALKERLPKAVAALEKLRKELDAIPNPDPREIDCYRILVRRVNVELDGALTGFLNTVEEPDSSIPLTVAVEEAKAADHLKTRFEPLSKEEKLTWTENVSERVRQLASVPLAP